MNSGDAATLCIILEGWLYRQEEKWLRHNEPPVPEPNDEVKRAAEALALASPETARHCHRLMSLLPAPTRAALASVDSEVTGSYPDWMTAEQAGLVLGIQPDSVRWLLRKGKLTGRKTEHGWRVNARAVERYREVAA